MSETSTPALDLADLGPAPELRNDVWLNSDPLRLVDLRGKVVLLEFWTFGCINCRRVIPYMREWHQRYAGDDFVVVTIHYPEFRYEEDIDNVRQALAMNEIEYAVAIDNDGLTWRAYKQRYWPTRYLIDREGHIRYRHIGEGGYDVTDKAIRQLLAEGPGS
jgi:thiol-disulfide isomerase/thioredoxin